MSPYLFHEHSNHSFNSAKFLLSTIRINLIIKGLTGTISDAHKAVTSLCLVIEPIADPQLEDLDFFIFYFVRAPKSHLP